jgi:hypothetical protein
LRHCCNYRDTPPLLVQRFEAIVHAFSERLIDNTKAESSTAPFPGPSAPSVLAETVTDESTTQQITDESGMVTATLVDEESEGKPIGSGSSAEVPRTARFIANGVEKAGDLVARALVSSAMTVGSGLKTLVTL